MKVILTKAGALNTGKIIFYKNRVTEISYEEFEALPEDVQKYFTVIAEEKKETPEDTTEKTPEVVKQEGKEEVKEEAPANVDVKTVETIEQEVKKEADALQKAAVEGTPLLKTDNGKDVKTNITNRNGRNRNV